MLLHSGTQGEVVYCYYCALFSIFVVIVAICCHSRVSPHSLIFMTRSLLCGIYIHSVVLLIVKYLFYTFLSVVWSSVQYITLILWCLETVWHCSALHFILHHFSLSHPSSLILTTQICVYFCACVHSVMTLSPQGLCLRGSRQANPCSEVSRVPVRHSCQEHCHQHAWHLF